MLQISAVLESYMIDDAATEGFKEVVGGFFKTIREKLAALWAKITTLFNKFKKSKSAAKPTDPDAPKADNRDALNALLGYIEAIKRFQIYGNIITRNFNKDGTFDATVSDDTKSLRDQIRDKCDKIYEVDGLKTKLKSVNNLESTIEKLYSNLSTIKASFDKYIDQSYKLIELNHQHANTSISGNYAQVLQTVNTHMLQSFNDISRVYVKLITMSAVWDSKDVE